jgi:ribokinase
MSAPRPRVGVVGHVEQITFAVVERLPRPGEIAHSQETFEHAAGGGAVAAVQMASLTGDALLLTALGDDDLGRAAVGELRSRGVEVHAASRDDVRTRRGWTYLDSGGERTITILDPRVVPYHGDALPWDRCGELDGIYLTGGDAAAVRAARAARVLVAAARAGECLRESGVELDVMIASAKDAGEAFDPAGLEPPPRVVVRTEGEGGGSWEASDGTSRRWEPEPLPGPRVDAYGCGDCFAAGLTCGLAAGAPLEDALRLAARCGASTMTGRGPYGALLGPEAWPESTRRSAS